MDPQMNQSISSDPNDPAAYAPGTEETPQIDPAVVQQLEQRALAAEAAAN